MKNQAHQIKGILLTICVLFYFLSGCSRAKIVGKNSPNIQPVQTSLDSTEKTQTLTINSDLVPASKSIISKIISLPSYEKFIYKSKFLGITIGRFIIENKGLTDFNGRQAYCFEVNVRTLPFFSTAFKTKDRYVSYMDAQDLVILRHEEYRGKILDVTVDFDYKTHMAHYKKYSVPREVFVPIPERVLDVFSGAFYLRMVPLELGEKLETNIYADQKIYHFIGLMESKTTVSVPGFRNEEVYFLKPQIFLDGKEITKISAEVYMSTAPSRKTLRALLKTKLGSVNVVLVEGFKDD